MRILPLLFAAALAAPAAEFTVYDLLPPGTHAFDIVYDVTAAREGDAFFFNPIRPGSAVSKERVVDLATGKTLEWEVADARLRVKLLQPVPKGGETRIRIYKTYTDAASYYEKDNTLVFNRPLGIKRNMVILPQGYELIGSASPAIVSTDADGRIRLSFVNDRDDELPVKITARRLP